MLIILPVTTFIATFLNILGYHPNRKPVSGQFRKTFLITCIFMAACLTLITEALSLFTAVNSFWITGVWVIALTISIGFGCFSGAFQRACRDIPLKKVSLDGADWLISLGITAIVLTLAIVAWIAPPNTTDSLLYHMPRVVHWIQNQSLAHYATAYSHQLWTPSFPEISILHLQLLYGNEQPANMVQWFSMVGSLFAVTAIAGLMGVSRKGQILAAAFVVSLPMGILQSTSTQTDYVAAFWILCLMYFVVLSKQRPLGLIEWLCLALSTGLGMLTKGTFYAYAFPILLWFFIPFLLQEKWRKGILKGLAVTAVVLVLNLGYWIRNTATFGNPLGARESIQKSIGIKLNPRTWIPALVTQVAINLPVPWEDANVKIISTVRAIDEFFGAERSNFNNIWGWNHEDLAGNPVHLLATLLAIPATICLARRSGNKQPGQYSLVLLGMFFFHAISINFLLYIVRYQLPLYVAAAPLIGSIFTQPRLHKINRLLAFGFLLISLPWVLFNSTRPIIGMRPFPEPMAIPCKLGCTSIGSVFTRSRLDLLYANWLPLREPITSAARAVKESGCQEVGLKIDSQHKEYLFLWSLGAAQGNTQVETIYPIPELEKYINPDFKPCAVVCSICGNKTRIYGLERAGVYEEGISVFMGPGFTYDEDS
jgi:4-amino-4-deoxy-L-arabinose transferase-like glycosyltransferase